MSIVIGILLAVLVLVCVLLVVTILMQPSKADSGIGAAFGGQATDALFGASGASVMAKITTYLTVIFFLLSFVLAILIAHHNNRESVGSKAVGAPTPAVEKKLPPQFEAPDSEKPLTLPLDKPEATPAPTEEKKPDAKPVDTPPAADKTQPEAAPPAPTP